MLKLLFIGPTFYGSTTSMRLDAIQNYFGDTCEITVINTQEIIDKHNRIARILAYRYKTGPIVASLSNIALETSITYDYIWMEKAVLFQPKFIQQLKKLTHCLIHFSPDPAFLYHKSIKFNKNISYYDFAVTTKSFELDYYYQFAGKEKTIMVNQAYSPNTHYITKPFSERKKEIVFIGHFEKNRGETLQVLLDNNFPIALAGRDWNRFVSKNKDNSNFTFLGEKLYGDAYRETLNTYQFSIGFLSEWIPEKHTTRSFEIPACGCILITPTNPEISSFYGEDEAIHYTTLKELTSKLKYFFSHDKQRGKIASRCHQKTVSSGFTHYDGIEHIFNTIS